MTFEELEYHADFLRDEALLAQAEPEPALFLLPGRLYRNQFTFPNDGVISWCDIDSHAETWNSPVSLYCYL